MKKFQYSFLFFSCRFSIPIAFLVLGLFVKSFRMMVCNILKYLLLCFSKNIAEFSLMINIIRLGNSCHLCYCCNFVRFCIDEPIGKLSQSSCHNPFNYDECYSRNVWILNHFFQKNKQIFIAFEWNSSIDYSLFFLTRFQEGYALSVAEEAKKKKKFIFVFLEIFHQITQFILFFICI